MAVFKHVWYFAGVGGDSFSETWYRDASTLAAAAVFDNAFLLPRLAMLHPLNTFQRARVSSTDPANSVAVPVNIGRVGTGAVGVPEPIDNSIVASLSGTAYGGRKWWQRGVPRGYYGLNADGSQTAAPGWQTQFDAFVAGLAAANFGMYILDKTPARFTIGTVDGSANDGLTIISVVGNPALAVGSFVNIYNTDVKQFPGLRGTYQVVGPLVVGAISTFRIRYRTPANGGPINTSGQIRARTFRPFTVLDPGKCGFDHYGAHDTRSTFSRSRGARRAKRLRNLV